MDNQLKTGKQRKVKYINQQEKGKTAGGREKLMEVCSSSCWMYSVGKYVQLEVQYRANQLEVGINS